MTRKTQTQDILNYLRKHNRGITSKQAFEMFGATRLSAIIFSLRDKGFIIESKDERVKTRYGNHVIVSRYILVSEPKIA